MDNKQYNPFQVLGLDNNCDLVQIKERFRDLSKIFHPDKQPAKHYETAKKKFQEIDSAYKMISTHFNIEIFENFGIEGVLLVMENQQKFKEIEATYYQHKDDCKIVQKLMKKIKSLLFQVYLDKLEKDLYTRTYGKVELIAEFYGDNPQYKQNYVIPDYWVWFYQKQAMMTDIYLQEFKYLQQEFYFYASHAQNINGRVDTVSEYGYRTQTRIPFPVIGDINFKTSIGKNGLDFSNITEISKQFTPLVNVGVQTHYKRGEFSPSLTLQLNDKNKQTGISFLIHSLSNIQFSGNVIVNPKLEVDVNYHKNSISIETTFKVHKHKYYRTQISANTKIAQTKQSMSITELFKSSFVWNITKQMNLELRSTVGFGRNLFEVGFSRGHSKVLIPIFYENIPTLSRSLILFSIPFVLPFLWENKYIIPPWEQKIQVHIEKRKQEIIQLKKINFTVQDRIQQDPEFIGKLNREIQSNGLIVKDAFLGFNFLIDQIFDKLPQHIDYDNPNLINCKTQLQLFVNDGNLFIKAGTMNQLPGLYLADPQIPLSHYQGIVVYEYKGKQYQHKWNLDEDLNIGNTKKHLSGFSLNQFLIQWVF